MTSQQAKGVVFPVANIDVAYVLFIPTFFFTSKTCIQDVSIFTKNIMSRIPCWLGITLCHSSDRQGGSESLLDWFPHGNPPGMPLGSSAFLFFLPGTWTPSSAAPSWKWKPHTKGWWSEVGAWDEDDMKEHMHQLRTALFPDFLINEKSKRLVWPSHCSQRSAMSSKTQ